MGNANSGLDFSPKDEITSSLLNASLQPWKVFAGVSKKDGSQVSIFSVDKATSSSNHVALAQNCVKKMKTLKHPFILRVLVRFQPLLAMLDHLNAYHCAGLRGEREPNSHGDRVVHATESMAANQ